MSADGREHSISDRGGSSSPLETALAPLVHELVRREAADEVRRLVREELAAGAGDEPELVSQARAGRMFGYAPQTVRGWQKDGLISKGRNGRVNVPELRRFLAERGSAPAPASAAAHPAHTDELRQERARRAAQDILGKAAGRRSGGR